MEKENNKTLKIVCLVVAAIVAICAILGVIGFGLSIKAVNNIGVVDTNSTDDKKETEISFDEYSSAFRGVANKYISNYISYNMNQKNFKDYTLSWTTKIHQQQQISVHDSMGINKTNEDIDETNLTTIESAVSVKDVDGEKLICLSAYEKETLNGKGQDDEKDDGQVYHFDNKVKNESKKELWLAPIKNENAFDYYVVLIETVMVEDEVDKGNAKTVTAKKLDNAQDYYNLVKIVFERLESSVATFGFMGINSEAPNKKYYKDGDRFTYKAGTESASWYGEGGLMTQTITTQTVFEKNEFKSIFNEDKQVMGTNDLRMTIISSLDANIEYSSNISYTHSLTGSEEEFNTDGLSNLVDEIIPEFFTYNFSS